MNRGYGQVLWKFKYGINFNFYSRYLQARRVLNKNKLPGFNSYELLEVGSGDVGIAFFFSKYKNIALDISFKDGPIPLQKKVIATSTALPFKSGAFNFVVSVDTLEHLPREYRLLAIKEMARVARKFLVITAPCSKLSEEYEERLLKLFTLRGRLPPAWLIEHRHNGLPQDNEIEELVKSIADKNTVTTVPYGNLKLWFIINCTLAYSSIFYLLSNLIVSVGNLFIGKVLINGPYYRKTVILEKVIA